MKIFIAAIAFAVTIGGLVLFNNFKTPAKNQDYAQIIDALKNQSPPTNSISPKQSNKLSKKSKVLVSSSKTPTPNTTLVKIPVSTPTPTPSATNSPSNSPVKIIAQATASPTPTPTPTPSSVASLSPTPSPSATPTSTPIPSATETPTPSVTPPPETSSQPSDYSITALVLTSPIAKGSTTPAELKIQTAGGATCYIKVKLPSGSISHASGIWDSTNGVPLAKTALTDGIIDWQWKISPNTTPSPPDAKIDLNCSKDGIAYSGYLQMTITQ